MNDLSPAELLEEAIRIAVEAHRGQRDRAGAPYILHPMRMMSALWNDDLRIAAVLHDVVEDTPMTLDDLRGRGFPEHIVEALDCLTHRENEPYEAFVQRAAANPIARAVKRVDLQDNMDVRRLDQISERDLPRFNRYLRAWNDLQD